MTTENKTVGETTQEKRARRAQEATIEVELYKGLWTDSNHKTWFQVLEDGWVFAYLDMEGNVVMTRNGYINRWRNKKQERAE